MKYVIAFFILTILISGPLYALGTKSVANCTLNEKERIAENDSSKYLIFCEEEVFENADSLWYWKWNSSDFYSLLEEGRSYEFKVYGWRIPILSSYRNIYEIIEL
jgi:hypothetical protein